MQSKTVIKRWTKIVLYGDSLTQWAFDPDLGCWASLLAHRMQRIADVFSRGFCGYNTAYCKLILPEILKEFNPTEITAFTVLIGSNDASLPPSSIHVPLLDYKRNLSDIITMIHHYGIDFDKLILLSPPPMIKESIDMAYKGTDWEDSPVDNQVTGQYARACKEVAKDFGVEHIDLYSEMMMSNDWSTYLSDGLHFSRKGAQFVFQRILPLIESRVMKYRGCLDECYPQYKDLDSYQMD